jgi:hypothetical protein
MGISAERVRHIENQAYRDLKRDAEITKMIDANINAGFGGGGWAADRTGPQGFWLKLLNALAIKHSVPESSN